MKIKARYLSYMIKKENPVYGQLSAELSSISVKSIDAGDSSNVFRFTMENHWGTHIDCPGHFFEEGLKAADYPAETWFFKKPFILQLELKENEIISPEHIGLIPEGSDLLIIQSGFSHFRGTEKYSLYNPGFKPETGTWLRREYPCVRAVGFDFISLSPYQNRELGREAHRAFLDPRGINSPILIIEDMDLSGNLSNLFWVWVVPLRIEELDSAPCTVIGVFK
ncbi:hypothetical protein HX99_01390 [Peptococcaceae bacterium SCADC1_2_3]|nr:hypothetical protein DK28_0214075 [Peptococcaceae bacterium SCADC1_2_3]KFI34549.1 hypothetical protein HX99_01390 [Peptococcaceae bacterium SCADC1_2_3]KFI37697.1 hypothetical protein HY02_04275 [Peptococcaceae bacterium SCADC1_2_3]